MYEILPMLIYIICGNLYRILKQVIDFFQDHFFVNYLYGKINSNMKKPIKSNYKIEIYFYVRLIIALLFIVIYNRLLCNIMENNMLKNRLSPDSLFFYCKSIFFLLLFIVIFRDISCMKIYFRYKIG